MKTIALNIFTNSTQSAPDTTIIEKTIESFNRTFGDIEMTIYCDSHPNIKMANSYGYEIAKKFNTTRLILTSSLSDGYIRSIQNARTDYLFQLEGDWEFISENIKHSLDEIIKIMEYRVIYHFRFNKRGNKVAVWDKIMNPKFIDFAAFDEELYYCESNNLSNNPHVIDVKRYRDEIAKHIKIKPGSKGIEEELNATGKYVSCIYGGLGYPATVRHLDGRKAK